MIDKLASAGAAASVFPTQAAKRTEATVAPATVPADTSIPDTPPAEVLHALDQAQQVMADLDARGLELHYAVTDGRFRAQLVAKDGSIVREMPARQGLDLLAGERMVDHKA